MRVFLHLDGRTQGGNAVWGAGADGAVGRSLWFEVLVTAGAFFCDIDARVLLGMQVTVQAHVCILKVGCKRGMQLRWRLGVLEVLVCKHCYLWSMLVKFLWGPGPRLNRRNSCVLQKCLRAPPAPKMQLGMCQNSGGPNIWAR